MPLKNKQIVVTRAPHQAMSLVEMLREKGAIPLIYPCIDIAPAENISPLDAALHNLGNYDWLVITSSNTVLAIKRRLQSLQSQPNFSRIKIAAVGESSSEAVESILGVSSIFVPRIQSAEGLADGMTITHGMRILLPQSAIARPTLAQSLAQQGADVTVVEAYQNTIGHGGEDIPTLIQENRVDAVTFTSSSTVENFITRIKPTTANHLAVACIGASTADTAWDMGFHRILVPREYSLENMVAKLEDYFAIESAQK